METIPIDSKDTLQVVEGQVEQPLSTEIDIDSGKPPIAPIVPPEIVKKPSSPTEQVKDENEDSPLLESHPSERLEKSSRIIETAIGQLPITALRKYKKTFGLKVHKEVKSEVAKVVIDHFLQFPIPDESKVETDFISFFCE
ncbi:hypothetical protein ADUPG1_000150 [Aduncisulcus paluster]|uniref:Histone deacetylase complex subunit SAP30 Sin3 binding domain-containing protein n=1 Tax=Aduncisulcus paluster TaxID=2918883 RepID=A0ABQ5K578_9EUKA|nr:hypothetical protein ADUPG1_000150 [Aduncisulcus paluster]